MKIIFELPSDYSEAIADITNQCADRYISEEKENLSGDQIIAIIAIAAPIVWSLIEKYLPDKKITIEAQLDDNTTVTLSERSVERAMMKYRHIRAEWEELNKDN